MSEIDPNSRPWFAEDGIDGLLHWRKPATIANGNDPAPLALNLA